MELNDTSQVVAGQDRSAKAFSYGLSGFGIVMLATLPAWLLRLQVVLGGARVIDAGKVGLTAMHKRVLLQLDAMIRWRCRRSQVMSFTNRESHMRLTKAIVTSMLLLLTGASECWGAIANGDFNAPLEPVWHPQGRVAIQVANPGTALANPYVAFWKPDSGGLSRIYQDFTLDTQPAELKFKLLFYHNHSSQAPPSMLPPDSLTASLLDEAGEPLIGPGPDVPSFIKGFLYLDSNGVLFKNSLVSISDPDADGIRIVTVDIHALSPGSRARLEFGLASALNGVDSFATIDLVRAGCDPDTVITVDHPEANWQYTRTNTTEPVPAGQVIGKLLITKAATPLDIRKMSLGSDHLQGGTGTAADQLVDDARYAIGGAFDIKYDLDIIKIGTNQYRAVGSVSIEDSHSTSLEPAVKASVSPAPVTLTSSGIIVAGNLSPQARRSFLSPQATHTGRLWGDANATDDLIGGVTYGEDASDGTVYVDTSYSHGQFSLQMGTPPSSLDDYFSAAGTQTSTNTVASLTMLATPCQCTVTRVQPSIDFSQTSCSSDAGVIFTPPLFQLHATTVGSALLYEWGNFPITSGDLLLRFRVASDGTPSPDGQTPSLLLEGSIDTDGDGISNYNGVLLTGTVVTIDLYNMGLVGNFNVFSGFLTFRVTGGQLASFWSNSEIRITFNSIGSSSSCGDQRFNGSFEFPFSAHTALDGTMGGIWCE